MNPEIVSVSSKGQIALPIEIRKQLSIKTGDKIILYSDGNAIILKKLVLPDVDLLKKQLVETQTLVKESNLKEEDIEKIIKEYRMKKW